MIRYESFGTKTKRIYATKRCGMFLVNDINKTFSPFSELFYTQSYKNEEFSPFGELFYTQSYKIDIFYNFTVYFLLLKGKIRIIHNFIITVFAESFQQNFLSRIWSEIYFNS